MLNDETRMKQRISDCISGNDFRLITGLCDIMPYACGIMDEKLWNTWRQYYSSFSQGRWIKCLFSSLILTFLKKSKCFIYQPFV